MEVHNMVKARDKIERFNYSVRLNSHLLDQLKHLCIDEKKTVGQLLEEGILLILKNRNKKIPEEFVNKPKGVKSSKPQIPGNKAGHKVTN
jgi:hypothetical protein